MFDKAFVILKPKAVYDQLGKII
jgi:nucleoside-diphosphate kinase